VALDHQRHPSIVGALGESVHHRGEDEVHRRDPAAAHGACHQRSCGRLVELAVDGLGRRSRVLARRMVAGVLRDRPLHLPGPVVELLARVLGGRELPDRLDPLTVGRGANRWRRPVAGAPLAQGGEHVVQDDLPRDGVDHEVVRGQQEHGHPAAVAA
jgi:hypothetical protein